MKKILFVLATFSFFSSAAASANTAGNYLSADALLVRGKFYEDYTQSGNRGKIRPSASDSSAGFGATYKYAINYQGAFIAPGIFFEQNNLTIEADPRQNRKLKIKNRYGARIDVGVDVVDHFAIYAIGGYSVANYSAQNYSLLGGSEYVTRKNSGSAGGVIYGIGMKTEIMPEVAVSIEYTTQNISATTRIPSDYLAYSGKYKARIDAAKLSIAYRF
jgi:opacity protein-like surface antigen